MACKYVIAMNGQVVVERWTGTVTRDELVTHKKQQACDPSINTGASVLSDCTRAVFSLSPDEVSELAEMERNPDSNSKIHRYAFLVSKDAYDKARQFSYQVGDYPKRVIIFNSLDTASLWLGLDSLAVRELMDSIAS